MAEFGDFELSGDRKALPPTAPAPVGPPPQGGAEPPVEPPRVRWRISSLAAPAVILAAALAILSVRPPEPTWTAGGPSSKVESDSPTTYPLVVRVAPAQAASGAAAGTVPTPVIEPAPGPFGATAPAEPPLELLTAADARDPKEAASVPKVAQAPANPPRLPEKPLLHEPVAQAPAPAPTPAPAPAAPPVLAEAPKPFTVAVPNDPIQTRLAVASIVAEARLKQVEAAQTAAMRNSIQQIERQRVAEQVSSERDSADRRRVEFRRELAVILERDGDRAAPAIWGLVESQHVEPSPVAEREITEALRARKGRLDRADRVAIFREHGLDESLIFAELYREQVQMMPARRGPRTREEAVVRAARALLAIEPESSPNARAVNRP